MVCVLLTWTAVDLIAPQLCDAEESAQSSPLQPDSSSQDRGDDCFCCSHLVDPVPFAVLLAPSLIVLVEDAAPLDLSPGIPRSLYHPPLRA